MSNTLLRDARIAIANVLDVEPNDTALMKAATTERMTKKGLVRKKTERKVTPAPWNNYLRLYIARDKGVTPEVLAQSVFKQIERDNDVTMTDEQKASFFNNVKVVNDNFEALGYPELIVPLPSIGGKKSKSSVITEADLDLDCFEFDAD